MNKKLLAVLLSLCMALSLAACSKPAASSEPAPQSTENPSEEPSSAPGTQDPSAAPSTEDPSAAPEEWVPGPEDFSYLTNDNGFIAGVTAGDLIDLPDFSQVTFLRADYAGKDEEVDAEIEAFLSSVAEKIEDPEYTIKKGDILVADYEGKFGDIAFSGGTAVNVEIEAGGVGYIDDFQDQLIGHHPGEEFDIEVTFPVPYPNNPDYAGKDATFTITVHSVKITPELSGEFIAAHQEEIKTYFGAEDGDIESVEALRAYIKESLTDYKINQAIAEYAYGLELKEYTDTVKNLGRKLVSLAFYMTYGIDIDTYQTILGYSDEDMDGFVRTEVTPVVFYQAIAEQEGWEVGEADFPEITGSEDNAKYIDYYGKGYLSRIVIEKRAMEYMREQCDIH